MAKHIILSVVIALAIGIFVGARFPVPFIGKSAG